MKILIIRFSSIGDIAWTSPVIRCCKLQIPGAEVHFCTKRQFRTLVEHNPYLDKIHYLESSLDELLYDLKAENFDFVIDLHGKIRSIYISWVLNKKTFRYQKLTLQRFLFTKFQINLMPQNTHVVDRYMNAVKKLGVVNDNRGLDFFISQEDEIEVSALPEYLRNGFASFVIGASQFTKKLPVNKMAELCSKIDHPIVLIGGREDFESGQKLIEFLANESRHSGSKKQVFNACGKFSIAQSASLLKHSAEVYGHDTGLTHIAAAFGKKIYSIWGPTSPLGFAPYMADNFIIENNNLSCRPCSKSGSRTCPQGHFKCMKEVEFLF